MWSPFLAFLAVQRASEVMNSHPSLAVGDAGGGVDGAVFSEPPASEDAEEIPSTSRPSSPPRSPPSSTSSSMWIITCDAPLPGDDDDDDDDAATGRCASHGARNALRTFVILARPR